MTEFLSLEINKLANRKFQSSEKLIDYYNYIKKIAAKIQIGEEDVLYYFLNGLNATMKAHIICQAPANIDEAFKIGKKLEEIKI